MDKLTRILLTGLAGYCDTVTFVHMKGVFSAHVTGNFVLFAAALVRGVRPEDYLKLLTLPVFVLAVAMGTVLLVLASRRQAAVGPGGILCLMALLFAAGAALAGCALPWRDETITLLVVFALGLQNALHPFIPGPMTTVMTGTVTNAVSNATRRLMGDAAPAGHAANVNALWLMAVFAVGCLGAAWALWLFGFFSLALPAVVAAVLAGLGSRKTGEAPHA